MNTVNVPPQIKRIASFLEELAHSLGQERVLSAAGAQARYGRNTIATSRCIDGAVLVHSTAEVGTVVRLANAHRVPLYPISTGHNWGYGSANPVTEGCVIVDLSSMNRVVALDEELSTVTVQPGVTQQILKDYLDQNQLDFLVPVHGGGPSCSLLGNALERGYGITPLADHFGAVTSLTAVLANGTIYQGALHAAGVEEVDRIFKWGVGPYLDGLFTQSNFGIVTEMTIALARRPQRIEAFYFWVAQDSQLEEAVERVREVLRQFSGVVGSVNLMNDRRVLSMAIPFPADQVPLGSIMSDDLVRDLAKKNDVPAWMGIGALYGDRKVVAAACSGVARLLRPVSRRLIFLSTAKAQRLRRLLGLLPDRWVAHLTRSLDMVIEGQAVLEGKPSQLALRLAYWKSGQAVPSGTIDPAQDGCGLLWYSPLVPMRARTIRDYVEMVKRVAAAHGIEPLITLTSLSERCFDSTVPLLFDSKRPREIEQARACYANLLVAGLKVGCFPYRFSIDHMREVVDAKATFWRLARVLKSAVDPNEILAPGRYSLLP